MEKITLYHYTDIKDIKKIDTSFFGSHYFTDNDAKISGVKRAFYYTEKTPFEYFFTSCRYCYITEVNAKGVYDLKTDKKKLLKKFRFSGVDNVNISALLRYLKSKGFKGVLYNINLKYDVVCLFNSQKVTSCIDNKRII